MKHPYVSGIQQIGIGLTNAIEGAQYYKNNFAMKTLVFDDKADATLMTEFTGGDLHKRQAILAMNLKGGGGFELWQFLDRQPKVNHKIELGDLGIFAAILKCADVEKCRKGFSENKKLIVTNIHNCFSSKYFYVKDQYGNNFKIIESSTFFQKTDQALGGVTGAVIGVSNMNSSIDFYKLLLGIDSVLLDESDEKFRTVVLEKKSIELGAFSRLFGDIRIELVQDLQNVKPHIFKDRYWGDCGFIHLCLDVTGMDDYKSMMEIRGFKFSVDSANAFAMSSASGRFCYVQDPDGTLIELVETHKVPIVKYLGIFLNLQKRKVQKPLPDWMIKLMSLSKV